MDHEDCNNLLYFVYFVVLPDGGFPAGNSLSVELAATDSGHLNSSVSSTDEISI